MNVPSSRLITLLAHRRWKTADGKVLTWGQMSIDHLSNAYHMLRQRQYNFVLDSLGSASDDHDVTRSFVSRVVASTEMFANELEQYIKYRVIREETERGRS